MARVEPSQSKHETSSRITGHSRCYSSPPTSNMTSFSFSALIHPLATYTSDMSYDSSLALLAPEHYPLPAPSAWRRSETHINISPRETDLSTSAMQEIPLNSTPVSPSTIANAQEMSPSPVRQVSVCASSSSSSVFCRICHEGEDKEHLFSPCKCTGSMGLVHRTCLEHWLTTNNSAHCEICQFQFVLCKKHLPFTQWLRHPSHQSDRRNLICDLTCFLFITPSVVGSVWVCFSEALNYFKNGYNRSWATIGLTGLSLFILIIYLMWLSVAIRYHVRVFLKWRKTTSRIHLLSAPLGERKEISLQAASDLNNNTSQHGSSPSFTTLESSLPSMHSTLAHRVTSHPATVLDFPRRISSIRGSMVGEVIEEENEEFALSRITDTSASEPSPQSLVDVVETAL